MDTVLESTIENWFAEQVRRLRGRTIKLNVNKDDPDRLVLLPHGVVFLCELKRPRKVPRASQLRAHARLRRMGHVVLSFDGVERGSMLYVMRRAITIAAAGGAWCTALIQPENEDADIPPRRVRARKRSRAV